MNEGPAGSEIEATAQRFVKFAQLECPGSTPLYERLSFAIAQDRELLGLAAQSRKGQPVPNLFFGAVQYLLFKTPGHPLARFYPSLSENGVAAEDPFPSFKAFCLENRVALLELISTRLVQTNEVRRCAHLFAACSLLPRGLPLALVEIGASGGLNLLWDQYGYQYGNGHNYGDRSSPVQINCRLRGEKVPPFSSQIPAIASRVGIDLNPLNVRDPDTVAWLEALIWPEHRKRRIMLDSAVRLAAQHDLSLVRGDALAVLPGILENAPFQTCLCIYHSYTLNQFSKEARQQLWETIKQYSVVRPIYMISLEWIGGDAPRLGFSSFEKGEKADKILAYGDPHGEWLEWLY